MTTTLYLFLLLLLIGSGRGFVRLVAADMNGDGQAELVAYDGNFLKVLTLSGEQLAKWSYKVSSGIVSADLNSDGLEELVFGTDDGRVVAIGINGTVWSFRTGTVVVAPPLVSRDSVVVVDFRGGLFIMGKDGQLKWKGRLPGCCCHVQNQPAMGDLDGDGREELVVAADIGKIFVFSGEKVLKNFTIGGFPSKPKVVNGSLLIGTHGRLLLGEEVIELDDDEFPIDYTLDGWITTKRVVFKGVEVYRGNIKGGVISDYPVFVTESGLYIYNGTLQLISKGDFLLTVHGKYVYALSTDGSKIFAFRPIEKREVSGSEIPALLLFIVFISSIVYLIRRRWRRV